MNKEPIKEFREKWKKSLANLLLDKQFYTSTRYNTLYLFISRLLKAQNQDLLEKIEIMKDKNFMKGANSTEIFEKIHCIGESDAFKKVEQLLK